MLSAGVDLAFEATSDPRSAHAHVEVVPGSEIVRRFGAKFKGLSAAAVAGAFPRVVCLNLDNIRSPPPHFDNRLMYFQYVFSHEVLHAVGLPPQCDIMLQQTRPDVVDKANCRVGADYLTENDVLTLMGKYQNFTV
jgi:hypothetical protein